MTYCLGAPDRNDHDSLGGEIPTPPSGKRLERDLVAETLDEDDRACLVHVRKRPIRRVRPPGGEGFDACMRRCGIPTSAG